MTTELSDALVTIGRIVVYVLSVDDAMKINRRRTDGVSIAERMHDNPTRWPAGAQAHIGKPVAPGQHFPAMVVRAWEAENEAAGNPGVHCVNLQVFLDGTDVFWARRVQNDGDCGHGTWHWPKRG